MALTERKKREIQALADAWGESLILVAQSKQRKVRQPASVKTSKTR
jgi:hypothetical protein